MKWHSFDPKISFSNWEQSNGMECLKVSHPIHFDKISKQWDDKCFPFHHKVSKQGSGTQSNPFHTINANIALNLNTGVN